MPQPIPFRLPSHPLPLLVVVLASVAVGCGALVDREPQDLYGDSWNAGEVDDPWQEPGNPDDASAAAIANPFVETAHDPLSTFAADVDTASYQVFLRDVADGYLPSGRDVRIEDFVNYFSYTYPTPALDDAAPFAVDLAASRHPLGRDARILRVGIQAAAPPPGAKKPANLVFLVDVSGSMSRSDKLPLAQSVLRATLEVLDPADTVAIVTYAGSAGRVLDSTPVADGDTITEAIDALASGGSTNGAGGIHLAYETAEAAFLEGGVNHVILCTDGDFNVGVANTTALVSLIEEKRATGITFTALGFGTDNLNDDMMERISNAGNGIYGFIGSEEEAARYASTRMLSTLHHIAKDMKIQVEWNPAHVLAHRLIGYENRLLADEDFREDAVDAGEVGAGHRVTALYEFIPVGEAIPTPEGAPGVQAGTAFEGDKEIAAEDFVRVKVRWKDVGATAETPAHETFAALTPATVEEDYEAADPDLLWASAVAGFAERLRGSPFAETGAEQAELDRIARIVAKQRGLDDDRERFADAFGAARLLIGMPE